MDVRQLVGLLGCERAVERLGFGRVVGVGEELGGHQFAAQTLQLLCSTQLSYERADGVDDGLPGNGQKRRSAPVHEICRDDARENTAQTISLRIFPSFDMRSLRNDEMPPSGVSRDAELLASGRCDAPGHARRVVREAERAIGPEKNDAAVAAETVEEVVDGVSRGLLG